MPSGRSPDHLATAIALAERTHAVLVVLATGVVDEEAFIGPAQDLLRVNGVVVEVPDAYAHPLLDFSSSSHDEVAELPYEDLSRKRNLGLLLAKLAGWRSLLFLDDDIRGLDAGAVAGAVSALGRCRAAGFKVKDFPDNSAVCHAHRLTGGEQGTFVAGNALVVDVGGVVPFFPDIYNEDWLFLWEFLRSKAVTVAGRASQLPYDPFDAPERALAQEFGDVVGEGLLSLLHDGAARVEDDPWFWRGALAQRRALLERIVRRLSDAGRSDHLRERAAEPVVVAAERRARALTPRACSQFVRAWQGDLSDWEDKLSRLPSRLSLDAALSYLSLSAKAT